MKRKQYFYSRFDLFPLAGYTIPKCNKTSEYLDFVSNLPATDSPEAFGLHPNADITYQSTTAKRVLDTILQVGYDACMYVLEIVICIHSVM